MLVPGYINRLSLFIKCFGNSNISVQNFAVQILYRSVCGNKKFCEQKFNIHVSSFFMSSLHVIRLLSKKFWKYKCILRYRLNHFFLHLTCNEALDTVCIIRAPPSKMREPYSNHCVCLSVRPSVCPSTLCCNAITKKCLNLQTSYFIHR